MMHVLLDSNLLVLWTVGCVDSSLIPNHPRTRTHHFTGADFDLLAEFIQAAGCQVTTSAVLAETSNLLGKRYWPDVYEVFSGLGETKANLSRVLADDAMKWLGFTDCVLLDVAMQGVFIVTVDAGLHHELLKREFDCCNFNHVRMH